MKKEICGTCSHWYCGKCNFHEKNTDVLCLCSNYEIWRGYE